MFESKEVAHLLGQFIKGVSTAFLWMLQRQSFLTKGGVHAWQMLDLGLAGHHVAALCASPAWAVIRGKMCARWADLAEVGGTQGASMGRPLLSLPARCDLQPECCLLGIITSRPFSTTRLQASARSERQTPIKTSWFKSQWTKPGAYYG